MTTTAPRRHLVGDVPADRPARVLVVDDEPAIREMPEPALGCDGFEVRTAADVGEAVPMAREFRPDAVLLDVITVVGDLVIDEGGHRVTLGGREIRLSATEFALLHHLGRNAGRVVSQEELFDRVSRRDSAGRSSMVEVTICALRQELDDGGAPMIRTVRGTGYVLEPAA